jgi:subtilisin family serine protease
MKSSLQNYFRFIVNLKYLIAVLSLVTFNLSFAQTCYPYLLIPNLTVTAGQSANYNVQQYIQANTCIIYNGGKARFQAENKIILKPGFRVFAGGEFKGIIQACTITPPNDELFGLQWGHRNTGNVKAFGDNSTIGQVGMDAKILEAWNITKGSPGVIVAIIDTGLDIGHPDIDQSRIYKPYNFVDNTTIVDDAIGHGTIVTGIIAATVNNGIGIAGIDQYCKIMPLKFDYIAFTPSDVLRRDTQIANAFRYALDNGARIINFSLGGEPESSQIVREAVENAISRGAIIISAAGNQNKNNVHYPSKLPGVISVGASTPCGTRKVSVTQNNPGSCDKDYRVDRDPPNGWGSNYGDGLDILAPGVLTPTTDVRGPNAGYSISTPTNPSLFQSTPDGNYIKDLFGTSLSSPFVAGVVSLMLSLNPNLSSQNVDFILKNSATNLADGNKMINARAALEMAQTFTGFSARTKLDVVNSFDIYPNPAQDIARIDFNGLSIEKIIVTNILGERKIEKNLNGQENNSLVIDTSHFTNGVYFVSLIAKEGETYVKKLIKN